MDYPLLSFQQVAEINDISFFGQGALSLDLKGTGFSNVTAVLINGHRSPTFVVMNSTRLLAEMPQITVAKPIQSITVLKSDIRESKASVISFEANLPPIGYSDKTILVQRYLKRLLTNKGSDIFSPTSGGDLLRLVGSVTRGVDVGNLGAMASMYAQQTASQIIEAQANLPIPLEAQLKSVTVISAEYNKADTSLDLRLAIEAMDGSRAIAGLAL